MSEAPPADQRRSPAPTADRGRTVRAADAAWDLARRIHLGTRKPANWLQLFQFAVVGGSGYVINLAVFALLTSVADVHHLLAAVAAFVVAVTNNFILNRIWTFRSQGARDYHAGFQAARFFAVSVAGLGVNLLVLVLLVDLAGVAELPAQAIAVAVATPVNFIGNKLWTFDRDRRSPR
jgi:dolichol-phosphate mannosyltransferase